MSIKRSIRHLLSYRPLVLVLSVGFGMGIFGLVLNAQASQPVTEVISSKPPDRTLTNHQVSSKVAPAPVVTVPAPATVKKAITSKTVATSPPQPVVTPAPSSDVSGLTPTTPATGSSSSSGSSGGGSSTTTTTSYSSTNWSGYMATSSSYSAISGAWTVPTVTGNGSSQSADATWIGIGGVSTNDLIQVGTDDIVSASGQVTVSAFYEMLPAASLNISSMTVSAGDRMNATLTQTSSSQWTITINDLTSGGTFSISVAYSSTNSSAEWIEEDPSYSRHRQIPFDNFGSVSFSGGSTVAGGSTDTIASALGQPITMVNSGGTAIAIPSALGGDGASFSVTP